MNFKNKTMIFAIVFGLLLSGCGGGGGSGDAGAPTTVTETVGSGGGSVSLPDKTIVTIDSGILKDGTTITVTTAPAPSSTSAEIKPISSLITVTIPPGSLLSSALGLDGISVEIALDEGQTNKTSALREAPALISKSYRVLKATLKAGKDQVVYYGKLTANATVATGKLAYKTISGFGQAVGDLELKGVQLVGEFIAERIQPNVPTAGTLFEVKSVGNFKDSLTQPRPDVPEGKLPLVLVHGFQLFCDGNAEAYIETWEKDKTTGFIPSFFSNPELQDKYQLFSFSYQTDLSIKENGRLLATALRVIFGERPSIVVAHSMGGLVTRSAMVHHVSIGTNIGGVITLATPHHGTKRIQEVGGFIDKAGCIFATEAQGAKDLAWDNFDDLSKGCVNPFLCGTDGLNKKDTNYQKYIPYAGVWDPFSLKCLTSVLRVSINDFFMCEGANLLKFLGYDSDGNVPEVSARFTDFNGQYQDKPEWAEKLRTYPDIHHVSIHDDDVVFNQIAQDLLAFYDLIANPPPVTNTPPTATITSPVGGTFTQGDVVAFSGTGDDVEDGALSGGSLVWTSNIDGLIGTGISFTSSDLSVGTHNITLTATDTQGAIGSNLTSITIDSITDGSASLTITKPGTGSGTVTSADSRINCGVTCESSFDSGTIVNLMAISDSGSTFAGWTGGCTGTGACTLTMNADTTVNALFNLDTTLEGSWRKSCKDMGNGRFSKSGATFSGTKFGFSDTNYSDSACSVVDIVSSRFGTFDVGNSIVASLGVNAQEIDFAILKKDGTDVNEKEYDIFSIESEKLYLGDSSGEKNGISVGKRPITLDSNYYTKVIENELEKLEPREVIDAWNDALYDGNILVAEKYTSETALAYIKNTWGSLEQLSLIYQQSKRGRARTETNTQDIAGDVSIVKYTAFYPDGSVRIWEDTLFLEQAIWKVAPQFVRVF